MVLIVVVLVVVVFLVVMRLVVMVSSNCGRVFLFQLPELEFFVILKVLARELLLRAVRITLSTSGGFDFFLDGICRGQITLYDVFRHLAPDSTKNYR